MIRRRRKERNLEKQNLGNQEARAQLFVLLRYLTSHQKKKENRIKKDPQIPVDHISKNPFQSLCEVLLGGSSCADTAQRKYFDIMKLVDRTHSFTCRSLTVVRTVSKGKEFDDEPTGPALGNLATHLKAKHANVDLSIPPSGDGLESVGELRGISAASAHIMEEFLKEGALNPALDPTQKGFYKVFAAWILEDDLPFTTGETSGIKRLFKYMQSRFSLPSDTTVRNELARIFSHLHGTVKNELKACYIL